MSIVFRSLPRKSGIDSLSGKYLGEFSWISQLLHEEGEPFYLVKTLVDWDLRGDRESDHERFDLYLSKMTKTLIEEFQDAHQCISEELDALSWDELTDEQKIASIIVQRLYGRFDWAIYGDSSGDSPRELLRECRKFVAILSQCHHPEHVQFCFDMEKAGIQVEIKRARACWHGPVVKCQDISQVMSKTQVPCLWDESGKHGFEAYPKAYSKSALAEAIAKFDNPEFQASLAEQLRCSYPLKGIAQNLVDHLASYFPEKIVVKH